jgi:hypothetical protein
MVPVSRWSVELVSSSGMSSRVVLTRSLSPKNGLSVRTWSVYVGPEVSEGLYSIIWKERKKRK